MKKTKLRMYVTVAMLSSISFILMKLDFPLPTFPTFLKVDFSDIPALLAALIFGPIAGILVELFKNALYFISTGSPAGIPIDEIANFVAGISLILPTYFVYKKLKTKKGMTLALILGTLIMAVMMSVLNYFVFLPAYTALLKIPDMRNLVVPAILPFNIIKGVIMSIIFMLLFVKMKAWIDKFSVMKNA